MHRGWLSVGQRMLTTGSGIGNWGFGALFLSYLHVEHAMSTSIITDMMMKNLFGIKVS